MNLKCLYADIIQEIRQLQDITMHFMLILHFFQYQIFFLYLLFYWGLLLLIMDLELGKNWGIPSYYKTTQLTPALYKLINHQVNISTAVSVVPIEEEVFNAIHRNEPST